MNGQACVCVCVHLCTCVIVLDVKELPLRKLRCMVQIHRCKKKGRKKEIPAKTPSVRTIMLDCFLFSLKTNLDILSQGGVQNFTRFLVSRSEGAVALW